MNKLYNAMNTNSHLTNNGAVTHGTSGKYVLDLFFTIGAMRKMSDEDKIKQFLYSYQENPELTTKMLFYARDCRGGQGERDIFRTLFKKLYKLDKSIFIRNLHLVPFYGRWDDLFWLVDKIRDTDINNKIVELIKSGINNKETRLLVGKWLPRESSRNKHIARILAKLLDINMKEYRSLCVSNSETVEQLICKKQWNKINYEHIPSHAMLKYNKTFLSNDAIRFKAYMDAVSKGEKKINASVLNPCNIVADFLHGNNVDKNTYNNLWNNLPNYLKNDKGSNILVMADVSGSMLSGLKGKIQPIDVSVSLALYLSERMSGVFKDYFMTFSGSPALIKVVGTNIVERAKMISQSNWGMNTNLNKAFKVMLSKALENNVPETDMPEYLLIISDMEFDRCTESTNYTEIRKLYEQHGYTLPKIVFWNVNGRLNNVPVKEYDENTALVSGFSPSLISPVLNVESFNPMNVLLEILNQERYNLVITK